MSVQLGKARIETRDQGTLIDTRYVPLEKAHQDIDFGKTMNLLPGRWTQYEDSVHFYSADRELRVSWIFPHR